MNIREEREKFEREYLSVYACKSYESKGRLKPEKECDIRTVFKRDRDRIVHSKAFRRLKHKTQVYIMPEKDHYRTRLTHTLEVEQIGVTIARALKLNEDLTSAIALAHDIGHTPFGHMGEKVLNKLNPNGFKHANQSLRVVDFLEINDKRQGLNLTHEVRDGILNHNGDLQPETLEGEIIKIADKIAYINHDIDDAIRAKIISKEQIPTDLNSILGNSHGERIDTMVKDIIYNSMDKDKILMSSEIYDASMKLREFMFNRVYFSKIVTRDEHKVFYILKTLYKYYKNNIDKLPESHKILYKNISIPVTEDDMVSDYIAGMTDNFIRSLFKDLFIPKSWEV